MLNLAKKQGDQLPVRGKDGETTWQRRDLRHIAHAVDLS